MIIGDDGEDGGVVEIMINGVGRIKAGGGGPSFVQIWVPKLHHGSKLYDPRPHQYARTQTKQPNSSLWEIIGRPTTSHTITTTFTLLIAAAATTIHLSLCRSV